MARRSPDPTIAEISEDAIEALLARCAERLAPEDHVLIKALVGTLLLVTRLLREGRATLKRLRRLFGLRSSEKTRDLFPKPAEDGGGLADGGASVPQAESSAGASSASPPQASPTNRRKGHGRRPASAYVGAEHIAVPHQSLRAGDRCPACEHGSLYDLKQPALFLRIIGQAPLAAKSWDCQQLRCSGCGAVHTAKPPPEACGPKFSESAASVIAVLRFGLGTPHYRLGRLQEALGTPVPDATQWDVLYARAQEILPAFQELLRLAAQAPLLHNDDTHMRVLQFMGKRRAQLLEQGQLPRPDRTGLYTTAIVALTVAGPIALFFTGRRHAGENLAALLDRRVQGLAPPLLMCDALDHNLPKGHPVEESNCLIHGRRGVVDQVENFPAECRHVLEAIGQVYAVEAACREEQLSPEARLFLHQLVSAPVMKQLRIWMTTQLQEHRIEPNSDLGKAFNYLLTRWDKLTVFLRQPGAPLDNNLAERVLKLAIMHRKNSLFYRSGRGAVVGDIYMTLIHTAVLHGENPIDYLTALMAHAQAVAAAPADWMPWNYRQTLAAGARAPVGATAAAATAAAASAVVQAASPSASTPAPTSGNVPVEAPAPTPTLPTSASASPSPPPAPARATAREPGQAKRSARKASRAQPNLAPPPAFILFLLLILLLLPVSMAPTQACSPVAPPERPLASAPQFALIAPLELDTS